MILGLGISRCSDTCSSIGNGTGLGGVSWNGIGGRVRWELKVGSLTLGSSLDRFELITEIWMS